MKQVDVVIMGQNYSTSLGLILASGEAGHVIGAVHYSAHSPIHTPHEFRSKYVVSRLIAERGNDKELICLLNNTFSNKKRKIVLLPADDYAVGFIDRNINELEKHFMVPNIGHKEGEMTKYMDKGYQSLIAQETGFLTARCWEVSLSCERIQIPDDIRYPCFTKPQQSIGASKSLIRRCNDRNDLVQVLTAVNRSKPSSILVEEYINFDVEYTVPILAMGEMVLIPAFLQKTRTGAGMHKGVTISGKVLSSKRFPTVTENIISLIKKIGLQGVFDIELLQKDNMFYFNELNLRNGAAGYALTRAGINFPAMWIDYCQGLKPSTTNLGIREGLTFVSDKAAIDNYRAGYMNWKEYRKTMKSVDFRFLVDSYDPVVRLRVKMLEIKTFLSRMFKR